MFISLAISGLRHLMMNIVKAKNTTLLAQATIGCFREQTVNLVDKRSEANNRIWGMVRKSNNNLRSVPSNAELR
jgi:hypothetical protein